MGTPVDDLHGYTFVEETVGIISKKNTTHELIGAYLYNPNCKTHSPSFYNCCGELLRQVPAVGKKIKRSQAYDGYSSTYMIGNVPKRWESYCGLLNWNFSQFNVLKELHPLWSAEWLLYSVALPEQAIKQFSFVSKTPLSILDTGYTTIALNVNNRSNIHLDKYDYKEGMSHLVEIHDGEVEDVYLLWPTYKLAFSLMHGANLWWKAHEIPHATSSYKRKPEANRFSCVMFASGFGVSLWEKFGMGTIEEEKVSSDPPHNAEVIIINEELEM